MAVSAALLTGASSTTDGSSFVTASITPSANKLILVAVVNSKATTPDTPTISGNGLIWVQIATRLVDDGAAVKRVTLFRSMGVAPIAEAITIDFILQTQTSCLWSVVEFDGVDTGGTSGSAAIVQSATAATTVTATSLTVTLAAFSSVDNATYGVFGLNIAQDQTPGTGFTELHDLTVGTPGGGCFAEWRVDNDTTVDQSSASATRRAGVAVEIKAAAAVGGTTLTVRALMGVGL